MSEACLLTDRSIIRIVGSEARPWLQGLITNNVDLVSETRSIYSALLTPQGKILFDFFVLQDGDDLLLDVEAERRAEFIKRLILYKLRSDVSLDAEDLVVVAIYGSDAIEKMGLSEFGSGTTEKSFGGHAFIDPRDARLGLRVVGSQTAVSDELDAAMIKLADDEQYHSLRISLGVPNASADLVPDKAFVLESNLDRFNGVDFDKGCFIGQEVTARTKHRGNVRKSIMRVRAEGLLPEPGEAIKAGDVEIGTLLSGVGSIGLALVRTDRLADVETTSFVTAGCNIEVIENSQ